MNHRGHAIACVFVLVACEADKSAGDTPADVNEVSGDAVSECRPVTSPSCMFDSKACDCSVAFFLNHPETLGDTPRAKCLAVCASETPLIGEFGLNGTWCDAACSACITVTGLTCDACCLLSDLKPVGDLCDQIDGGASPCRDHDECDADKRCLFGSCQSSPDCGKPMYLTCEVGLNNKDCNSAGGRYSCFTDYFGDQNCVCLCPSGYKGCPCWRTEHCDGYCEVPEESMNQSRCEDQKIGVCSEYKIAGMLGCHCVLHETGQFNWICAD